MASLNTNGDTDMQDRDKNTNLIEQLQDAWAFESRLLELVDDQAGSCQDPQSRRLYREHARTTRTQIRRIDQRLKAIGCPASGPFTCGNRSTNAHR